MFCFKLWSKFGVFRDPLTITQNLTFPIPPKTTVGGMLASILGIDYNDYFNDYDFFNFRYSLVLTKTIRKKSFTQNYVADYTKNSEGKIQKIGKYFKTIDKCKNLLDEKWKLELKKVLTQKEEKFFNDICSKIEKNEKEKLKNLSDFEKVVSNCFRSPKPIYRELLLSPEYLIFIKDFKYEDKIISYMKNHFSEFSLYMGNSEFSANYQYIECESELKEIGELHSFTGVPQNIFFEAGKKYTNLYMAAKTVGNRQYRDYKNIVICDKIIKLNKAINAYSILTERDTYNCEFV